ncbi:piggyBac transposable element-derived protein 3-like [Phymastichus coffea]|uniref:piggyBac transposable element-derived protein 3-like n=1 Tax=Phymastichus coffea TaxID=108790 RepID=UPI00273CE536|nr:piggyBac transposable element-derived protein 3-like [Phymastichus coffea]
MSKRKSGDNLNVELFENDDYIEAVLIPDPDDSGSGGSGNEDNNDDVETESNDDDENEDDEDESDLTNSLQLTSFRTVLDGYDSKQKKLEPDHKYDWMTGECTYNDIMTNDILLIVSDMQKKHILSLSLIELFEDYFSISFKQYIIDATVQHGYNLSADRLDVFLGIVIFTSFNGRNSQRDYWSTDTLLRSDVICDAMGQRELESIKKHVKTTKSGDENSNDRIWKVRKVLDIFNNNLKKYGYFSTALSIDEMMIKFYGRSLLKQFIKTKPIRFGIKMWALCSSDDLLVYLKRLDIKATGTVYKDRITESINIDKNAARGTFAVKHNKVSGVNFITVVDSKQVSILSTAAGVTPLASVNRVNEGKPKKSTKDIAMSIAKEYLAKSHQTPKQLHQFTDHKNLQYCHGCEIRSRKFCIDCQAYFCENCLQKTH